MSMIEELPLSEVAAAQSAERRRQGRIEFENPHLIELLRAPDFPIPDFPAIEAALAENGQPIPLAPATAMERSAFPIIILMTLSFWAVVAGVLWRSL